MVSASAIIAMLVTLLLCFGVPVVLSILVARKEKRALLAVSVGALGFFVPQVIIRIPLLSRLSVFINQLSEHPWMLALVLGLSAALFETTGRLMVFQLLLKQRLTLRTGIAAGVGHGGIEAIYLVGSTYVNNLILSFMINSGGFDAYAQTAKLPQATIDAIKNSLLGTPASLFYAAGLERVFTIAFHIAMSVLLLQFILKRKAVLGFMLVTLLHTALDFSVVMFSYLGWGVWAIEGALCFVAAGSVLYLIFSKRFYPKESAPVLPHDGAPASDMQ